MSEILKITDFNKGATLKQGDSTTLKYHLHDADEENMESIIGSPTEVVFIKGDRVYYRTTGTINELFVCEFKIEEVLPTGIYHIEFLVDGHIFPSMDKPYFTLTASSKGLTDQIITAHGFEEVVILALQEVESRSAERLVELESNYATRLVDLETNDQTLTTQLAQTNERVSNVISTPGDGTIPTELIDSRFSQTKNKTYPTVSDRISAIEKGDLIAENVILNSDFSVNTAGWVTGGSTHSATDGQMVVTGNGTAAYALALCNTTVAAKAGEKWLIRMLVTPSDSLMTEMRLRGTGGQSEIIKTILSPPVGVVQVLSAIYTPSVSANLSLSVMGLYTNSTIANGAKFKVDKVVATNLTQTYGKGREPDLIAINTRLEKKFIGGYFYGKESLVDYAELQGVVSDLKKDVDELSPIDFGGLSKTVDKTDLVVSRQYNRNLITTKTPFDYTQTAAKTSPKRKIWTITYDDESKTLHQYALPIHKSENVPACFYVIPNRIGTGQTFNYGPAMTWSELKELEENGWEIGHHTVDHLNTSYMSESVLRANIEQGNEIFLNQGIVPKHFSHPGGSNNYNNSVTLSEYFDSASLTVPGNNSYDLNPWRLKRFSADAYASGINNRLNTLSQADDGWMITYHHAIHPTGTIGGVGGNFTVWTPTQLQEAIQYAKSLGIEVVTMEEGLRTYAPYTYFFDEVLDPAFSVQRNGLVKNANPITS